MKYQAIIFDLDGTLLNTLDDLAIAFNIACGQFGCPLSDREEYKQLVGNGARHVIVTRFKQHHISEEHVEQGVRLFREAYSATKLAQTHPYPGIPEVLHALSEIPVKLNVLSNKPHQDTVQCIRQFFNIHQFEVVLGQQENSPLKPDPASTKKIMRQCGVPCSMGLFIGDTPVDIETAHNAHMHAVGVTWGFRTQTELEQCGADTIIHKPEDILSCL